MATITLEPSKKRSKCSHFIPTCLEGDGHCCPVSVTSVHPVTLGAFCLPDCSTVECYRATELQSDSWGDRLWRSPYREGTARSYPTSTSRVPGVYKHSI